MRKKVTIFLLIPLLLFVGGRTWYHFTDGLTMGTIKSPLELTENTIPEDIQTILSQPFTYFAKGCQSYAFLSEDGEYVLKCFKQQHLRPSPLLNALPSCSYKDKHLSKKAKFKDKYFSSIETAYKHIPTLCGLVFVHLSQNEEDFPIILIDKLGRSHTVSSDELPFILQKKGTPLREYEGEDVTEKLVTLLKERERCHVRDNDPAFSQNIAIVDGEPIFIDVGQMEYVPEGFSENVRQRLDRD